MLRKIGLGLITLALNNQVHAVCAAKEMPAARASLDGPAAYPVPKVRIIALTSCVLSLALLYARRSSPSLARSLAFTLTTTVFFLFARGA